MTQRENDLAMAKSCLLVARDCLNTYRNTKDPKYIEHTKTMISRVEKRLEKADTRSEYLKYVEHVVQEHRKLKELDE